MAEESPKPPEKETISLDGFENESISLSDEGQPTGTAVRAIGGGGMLGDKKATFKRSLNVDGQGATRCRMFRSRIAAASLEHMEKQINDWLDGDKIEIKHVGHVIGVVEGKTPEPNLLVMVWY
jgi:hypothetical protein